jgi:hypothetical protein
MCPLLRCAQVTWVDNLWVTMDMLGPHLWGFGSTTGALVGVAAREWCWGQCASVRDAAPPWLHHWGFCIVLEPTCPLYFAVAAAAAFPLFGAWVANITQGLRLPPLDNLLIMNTDAYK